MGFILLSTPTSRSQNVATEQKKQGFQAGHLSDAMILGKKSVHPVGCFQISWTKYESQPECSSCLHKDEHGHNQGLHLPPYIRTLSYNLVEVMIIQLTIQNKHPNNGDKETIHWLPNPTSSHSPSFPPAKRPFWFWRSCKDPTIKTQPGDARILTKFVRYISWGYMGYMKKCNLICKLLDIKFKMNKT